jgi:hypothetical protein
MIRVISLLITAAMSAAGQRATENDVRDGGSFPRKRSPRTGDGCAADHCQPGLLLASELASIADAEVGDRGICNGPKPDAGPVVRTVLSGL